MDDAELQRRLIARGFDLGTAGADGVVGPKTLAAIRSCVETCLLEHDATWPIPAPVPVATMRTSTNGLLALMRREAVVLSAYKDSKGIWTIGVGHTSAAGSPAPINGLMMTLSETLSLFRSDIQKYEAGVRAAVKVPVAQHEFDALVSFHYNTGGIARAKLTGHLNAGDRIAAAAGFMGWVSPPEIIGRRKEEQKLFATGDYGDLSTVPVYDKYPGKRRSVSTVGLI